MELVNGNPYEEPSVRFDYDSLPSLSDVRPLIPLRFDKPNKFVRHNDYLELLFQDISSQLEQEGRVPPMCLVGCSRSGKTATLDEIANGLPSYFAANGREPVTILYVTFNDYSSTFLFDRHDPFQALCQRLVFVASEGNNGDQPPSYYMGRFQTLRGQHYQHDPSDVWKWLGNNRVILLIDELSNLRLTSNDESDLGAFLRDTFLDLPGRYLIFTSHVLGAVETVLDNVDSSGGSSRTVIVQRLPIAFDLNDAVLHLDPRMRGPCQALYHGLVPGLIYDQRERRHANLKQKAALRIFNSREMHDKEKWIKSILNSFVSGNGDKVPPELHILLTAIPHDTAYPPSRNLAKISWAPSILQCVLRNTELQEKSWLLEAKESLALLCDRLKAADGPSVNGYKYLFAIAYLSRSIAEHPFGDVLPAAWFDEPGLQVQWNPFNLSLIESLSFNDSVKWCELERSVNVKGPQPTIAIFFSDCKYFERYDLIALLMKNDTIVDQRAFQLTQTSANARLDPLDDFKGESYLVEGIALEEMSRNAQKWNVMNDVDCEGYFGVSGRHWTPTMWNRLKKTFRKARTES
ncbi:hypothetical protein MPSEU_000336000 [Mayamaea pseudoterrestris]|nr:hypothetical protein MPSEU_000336000 [Mayamaea pseudoterrestris]